MVFNVKINNFKSFYFKNDSSFGNMINFIKAYINNLDELEDYLPNIINKYLKQSYKFKISIEYKLNKNILTLKIIRNYKGTIEDNLKLGINMLNENNFIILKSSSAIDILENTLIQTGFPNKINDEFVKFYLYIAYYYAKTFNYDSAKFWLEGIINSNCTYDKSWNIFYKILIPIIPDSYESEIKYWNQLDKNLSELLNDKFELNNPMTMDFSFYYAYYKFNPVKILSKYTTIQRKAFPQLSNNHYIQGNSNGDKIKVGFISSGFKPGSDLDNRLIHNSSLSDSFLPTILQLNKNKFDTILIYFDLEKPNNINDNNLYLPNINKISQIKIAQDKIKNLNLDILVFIDFHINPMINYLALSKLAKIQACTHGHPMTTGLPKNLMNYFISWGAAETKDSQKHYTEELILLPEDIIWEYYIPRNKKINEKLWHSNISNKNWGNLSRKELDFLPENCDCKLNWYFCPQASFKIHLDFDKIIDNILKLDESALIIMIKNKTDLYNLDINLINRFQNNNLNLNRIIFIEKLKHHNLMNMYQHCDVILDSFFFGGDTTTREALEIGAPIVTLPGQFLGGRWTQAYYKLIGITDLIVSNLEEYSELSVKIATNKEYSLKIRNKILNNNNKLFRSKYAVPSWENMLIKINSINQSLILDDDSNINNLKKKLNLNPNSSKLLLKLGELELNNNINIAISYFEKLFDNEFIDEPINLNSLQARYLALIIGRQNHQTNNFKKAEKFFKIADNCNFLNDDTHKIQLATNIIGYPESIEDAKNNIKNYNYRIDKLLKKDKIDISFLNKIYNNNFNQVFSTCILSAFNLEIYYEADIKSCMSKNYRLIKKIYPDLHYISPTINNIKNKSKPYKLGIASAFFNINSNSVIADFGGVITRLPKDKFDITFIFIVENNYNPNNFVFKNKKNLVILPNSNIKDIRNKISKLNLDLLLYLDSTMSQSVQKILMSKLATVQAVSHGHPVTSGIDSKIMDYYISWEAAELEYEQAKEHYTEKLILLPKNEMHQYYEPRSKNGVSMINNCSFKNLNRNDFSEYLPADGNWYTCMQKPFKLHPEFDYMITEIVKRDKKARIILHSDESIEAMNIMKNRIKKFNIDINRIYFIPCQPHHKLMGLYKLSDVILDSYYAGGCTTTREALEIGALVVTLPAKYLGGRWSLAYYNIIGVLDLVAKDKDDYINIALKIGNNEKEKKRIKNLVLNNINKLFYSKKAIESWSNILEKIIDTKNKKKIPNIATSKDKKNIKTNKDTETKIENNILFSCTTYLKNDEKYKILKRTLDSFIKFNKDDLHLINEFVILMEYTENNKKYLSKLKERYQNFTFIAKNKNQKGQAKSLNIIIDKLKDYKLWLHFEDSWYSIGPILKKATDTINSNGINYIQLIKKDNIYNIPEINNDYLECKMINDYKTIEINETLNNLWKYWEINEFDWSIWKNNGWWPLFSLTPLLINTNIILNTGYFSDDTNKWPFQFEFEWSLKWIRRNKIKLCVFKDINIIRDDNHVSTYNQSDYIKWEKRLECREKKEKYNRNVKYYTLKSDKLKMIFFWNPYCCSTIIKKFIFYIEEGVEYNGDIHKEFGNYNYNKYFIELSGETDNKYKKYKKILFFRNPICRFISFCNKNSINNFKDLLNNDILKDKLSPQTEYINKDWLDEIINIKDINLFLINYCNLKYNEKINIKEYKIDNKIYDIYKKDFDFMI